MVGRSDTDPGHGRWAGPPAAPPTPGVPGTGAHYPVVAGEQRYDIPVRGGTEDVIDKKGEQKGRKELARCENWDGTRRPHPKREFKVVPAS